MNAIRTNLHTHTSFSDGRDDIDAVIASAIERGFVSIGISDHSHAPNDDASMKAGFEREYVSLVRAAAERYRGKIDVFTGLELDSHSTCERELYDYVIGSVHAIYPSGEYCGIDFSAEAQRDTIARHFGGSGTAYAAAYYGELVRHVTESRPDIVGHFDLVTKFGIIDVSDPEYRRVALEALHACAAVCPRFEINTGAISRGYKSVPYPDTFLLDELCRIGAAVTVSADSHRADTIDCAFDAAAEAARSVGFKTVDALTRDGFVQLEL